MAKVGAHKLSALYNVLAWVADEKFKGLDVYNEVYFEDPVLNMPVNVKYVMAIPLFKNKEVLEFMKHRINKAAIERMMRQRGMKIQNAYFIDASDRVWVNYHVMIYLLMKAYPVKYLSWSDKRIVNYEKKLSINVESSGKFYFWSRKSKMELLNDTMMVQGAFVKRENAISLKQLADHYNKNIMHMINMLKRHGLISQIENRVTFWNPTLASNNKGLFGTYQPKDKSTNDKTKLTYANIYIDKVDGIGVLNNIIFNKQNNIVL